MPFRLITALILLCACFATLAIAESTDCIYPVLIVPDGRLTQSTFPQNTTYWYGIYAQANHSYSVEFVPAADNYLSTVRPKFSTIGIFGPTDLLQACTGTSSVAVTPTSGYSPVILKGTNGAGRRVSFTAQSAGLYLIYVSNLMGTGAYTFRAVDTTLFSVRWNTLSGYDAQWIFLNISDMQVTGMITILDMSGQVLAAVQISIPASGRVTRSSSISDVNLPRNAAGSVVFTHNGPPGAVLGEAFMIGATATLPEKFEPASHP